MGINIGTTITSQLVAFDIVKYSFVLFLVGVLISLVSNKKSIHRRSVDRFSLIFIGIELLTRGLSPLKTY